MDYRILKKLKLMSKHVVKKAEGWVEITYMDNTREIIRIHLEEDKMQRDLVERIYKILLDK